MSPLGRNEDRRFAAWPTLRREWDIRGARADVVTDGFVREISVLAPGTEPAEPLAEVVLLKREAPTSSPAAGEIIYGGGLLRRPACGRVLAVR